MPTHLSSAKVISLKCTYKYQVLNIVIFIITTYQKSPQFNHIILYYLLQAPIGENDSNCLNNEHNFFKKHSCDDDKVMIIICSFICHLSLISQKPIFFVSLCQIIIFIILITFFCCCSNQLVPTNLLSYTMVFFILYFTNSPVLI